jgi:hypothetical protein
LIVDVGDKVVGIVGVKVSWILHGEIHNGYAVFQEEISFLEKDSLRTTIHEEEFIGQKNFHGYRFQVSGFRESICGVRHLTPVKRVANVLKAKLKY